MACSGLILWLLLICDRWSYHLLWRTMLCFRMCPFVSEIIKKVTDMFWWHLLEGWALPSIVIQIRLWSSHDPGVFTIRRRHKLTLCTVSHVVVLPMVDEWPSASTRILLVIWFRTLIQIICLLSPLCSPAGSTILSRGFRALIAANSILFL